MVKWVLRGVGGARTHRRVAQSPQGACLMGQGPATVTLAIFLSLLVDELHSGHMTPMSLGNDRGLTATCASI